MSSGVLGCEMSFAKKNLLKVGYNAFLHSFFLSCSIYRFGIYGRPMLFVRLEILNFLLRFRNQIRMELAL